MGASAGNVKGSIALDRRRRKGDRKDIVECYSTIGNYLPQNIEDIEDIVEDILCDLDELDMRPVKIAYETKRLIPQPPGPRDVGRQFSTIRKRVAIIGKTGVGKSSLANYILHEERFKVGETSNRCTTKYQDEETKVGEEKLQIIDTPGFFDTNRDNNLAVSEIKRAQKDAEEGFHAFIFVANAKGPRDTTNVYNKILGKYRGIRDYLIVVFTRLENSVDDVMSSGEFSKICKDVEYRCLGVRTKDFRYVPSAERNETLTSLLHLINVCVHNNNGNVYTQKDCKLM
ncbi:GTPase IMAP family member 7 [Holothuria leucospilota]|uniref:GTPase IMAP family member 7 n=1 Tax=Holothuria leucospilota TaxID=206669 RepID=A0A9Q1CD03_HOLLE|nr:GTPase IMAP family member 7 [Holothuria leucospilota]